VEYVVEGERMARDEIKGEQYTVGELFSERFVFKVPTYQRTYAWTTEHAGALLDDVLVSLGDSNSPVDELSPYFLGSIVLIKGDQPDAQIVDGQQRLVTLTILLAVLRTLIPERFAEGITRRLYEPADPLNGVPARYRLQPHDRDAEFFQRYIQDEGGIQRLITGMHPALSTGKQNMRDNALCYDDQLRGIPEARRLLLAQYIIRRCLIVAVSTSDLNSAFRIFSILNNRGLDLTTADILKAEIIGKVPDQAQEIYAARWDQTEESLGTERFKDLPGYIVPIYRKGVGSNNTLEDFRMLVIEAVRDSQVLIDEGIVPYGQALRTILTANSDYEDEVASGRINNLFRWLRQVDNSDWVPPALLYLKQHYQAPDRLVRFFTELERLAASMMIRRQYLNRRRQRYARVIAAIHAGDDLGRSGSPLQLDREECDATIGQLNGEFYLMAASPRNYVLRRLDSNLAGAGAVYDQPIMTVEHVLPRTVSEESEWARWYPTRELRDRWTHRLGNLALLSRSKNSNASNYSFARKKTTYFAGRGGVSPFALTTQILREEMWTPDVIERRQGELIDHLKALWRLG
jgi:hypothetical protein